MYGYIYKTTNNVNGKIYVGKKESPIFDQSYYGSGKILKSVISKYGVGSLTTEVIEFCETREILNQRERFWIKSFDCFTPKGYNISEGGDWGDVLTHHPEREQIIEKIRNSISVLSKTEKYKKSVSKGVRRFMDSLTEEERKEKFSTFSGKKHTDEYKKKMSDFHKNRFRSEEERRNNSLSKKGVPNYKLRGRKKSPEEIAKLKISLKGKAVGGKNPRAQNVVAINMGTLEFLYFDTISECVEHTGVLKKYILKICRNRSEHRGGYTFSFKKDFDPNNLEYIKKLKEIVIQKDFKILAISDKEKLVFCNIKECYETLGFPKSMVIKSLRGIRVNNYKGWSFYEER